MQGKEKKKTQTKQNLLTHCIQYTRLQECPILQLIKYGTRSVLMNLIPSFFQMKIWNKNKDLGEGKEQRAGRGEDAFTATIYSCGVFLQPWDKIIYYSYLQYFSAMLKNVSKFFRKWVRCKFHLRTLQLRK